MKQFLRAIVFSLFTFFSFNSFAQGLPSAAMADLFSSREITKAQYDEFWDGVGAKNREEKKNIIEFMKGNFLLAQEHQREIWRCAKIAWNVRKVPYCKALKEKEDQLRANLEEVGQIEAMSKITDSANTVLNAAATHGKFVLEGTKETQMSLQLINFTEESIHNVFSKFEKILQLDYQSN